MSILYLHLFKSFRYIGKIMKTVNKKKKLRKQTDGNKNLYVSGDQSGKSFLVGHRHGQVNVFALLLLQNVLLDMI